MKIVFALSALLLLAAVPANAKGKKGAAAPSMDTNADGKVSLEEFKAAGKTEDAFKALDADKSGDLSKEELKGGAKKKKK